MAACVAAHAAGTGLVVRFVIRPHLAVVRPFRALVGLLLVVVACFAALHVLEILLWAVVYRLANELPDLETATYFSAVTYTTVGYGDITLPAPWRLMVGLEALTGILLAGWTSALIFYLLLQHASKRQEADRVRSS